MRDAERLQAMVSIPAGPLMGLAEALPVGVFRASCDGRLRAVNGAFRKLMSLADEAPLERLQLTELFGADILESALGRTTSVTPVIDRSRGRQLLLTLISSRDGQGQAVVDGVLAESAPADRQQPGDAVGDQPGSAERFQSIGRMAGSVAHDIANLVTTISGYGSLLQSTLPEQDPRRSDVDGILAAAEHCCGLARQLLNAGQASSSAAPQLDVSAITEDLLDVLQRLVAAKGRLVWRRSARSLLVAMDRLQFEQVLLNLVANARDALRPGGALQIEASVSSVLPGDERLPSGEYVCIAVSDEGVGMEAEMVERIFEPFFSTKAPEDSTGLGLSTVRSIIHEHHGDIRVVSTPGQGSCFTVLLPRLG